MKKEIKWDLLQPQDIEVRVGNKIKETDNVALLLYQDSRCTARNLDKQFGQFGWQIDYKVVGEQIYGTLSIWDEDKQQWVSKSDTGDKSNISEDKGQSSDILKRCAVRWGFGTELYTAPKIVLPNDGYGNTGYKVTDIKYNENREITYLSIANRFGDNVFEWGGTSVVKPIKLVKQLLTEETAPATPAPTPQNDNKYINELNMFIVNTRTEENKDEIMKFFRYYSNVINTKGWKGTMNLPALWNKWTSNNYS